jgi:hypothetical protein
MTRRDWYIGVTLIAVAVLLHALLPRYEWRAGPSDRHLIRIDRWTGAASLGVISSSQSQWKSYEDLQAASRRNVSANTPATSTSDVPKPGQTVGDVNLPVETKTYVMPANCTPEALKKPGDPLRAIDCALAEPLPGTSKK